MLAVHLLAGLALGAAGWLGAWQYDAWQAGRSAESVDLTLLEPVPLAEVMGPDDPFPGERVGQPVRLSGTWLSAGTVYVSGREHEGDDGYWVASPLAVNGPEDPGGGPAIFVVRGWVAEPGAAPAPPTGPVELIGWLQPTEGTNEADDDPTDDVLPQMRTADLIQRVDQDLYGGYVVLDATRTATSSGPDGRLTPATLEQLPEVGRLTAVRNLLYALEWWVFGGFALFIWWRFVRETQADSAASDLADAVPSDA